MSLLRLIEVLDQVGVDVDANFILDSLWLAAQDRHIELKAIDPKPPPPPPEEVPPVDRNTRDEHASSTAPKQDAGETQSHPPSNQVRHASGSDGTAAYAGADPFLAGRRATAFPTPAASPIFNSLAFMRALRPFRQRIASPQAKVVDEEATAQLTAELSMAGRMRVFPVTTPVYERWFDVDLVVEDDAATELWRETLRALAQTLRNSGAFRDVREWKLELPSAGRPAPLLHGAGGASIHAKALKGSERRIVLFASHGSSLHWSTGANSALLTDWATSCAVALFHLLPSSNWGRTPLGEPVGRNSTYKPGVSNRELEFSPFWWLPIEQPSRITSIPMVELSPSAVEGWAKMLMARGHTTPATVLHSTSRPNSVVPTEDKQAISRRAGALLSANPKAFQLAVLLSHSPFTIPVARLIQEAHFGRSDHRELCQLFMSGLLQLVPGQSRATFASWFTIHPEAADILRRSLRPHDAQSLSQALLQRVSNHIARMTGQHLSMTSFALDENGTYSVPEWARPFAIVASRLESDFSPPAATSETRFEAFWKGLSSSIQAYLLRVAVDDGVLSSAAIPKEFWPSLLNRTITELDADGDRRFTTAARTKLVEIDDASPLLGARILWVDDHPSNNKWLVEQMRASGARVQAVLSTSAALDALHNEFDVIISDMGRIEGEREGFVLLEQLRQSGISTPVIIFAGGFAQSPKRRASVVRAGAYFCTNNNDALLRHVFRLHREPGALPDEVFDELPAPSPSYFTRLKLKGYETSASERIAAGSFGGRASSVLVIGSLLAEFSKNVEPARRQLVVEQLLLADLVANAEAESPTPASPFHRFSEVLLNTGWTIASASSDTHISAPRESSLLKQIAPFLISTGGPFAAVEAIMPRLLEANSKGGYHQEWMQLYDRRISSLGQHQFQIGFVEEDGDVLRFSTYVFHPEGGIGAVQISADNPRKAEMSVESVVFELPTATALILQDTVRARIFPYLGTQVTTVEPPLRGNSA